MNETLTLKCGCAMKKEGKVFIVKPCNTLCPNFVWIMDESAQVGNAVMFIRIKGLIK